jgi:parallel beta-helix repeat protein
LGRKPLDQFDYQKNGHNSPNSNKKHVSARPNQFIFSVLASFFALVAALYPAKAGAQTITVIQRATLNKQPSSGGSVTVNLPKATGSRHAIIVGISFWPRDISKVTDSSGDVFVRGVGTSIYHSVSHGVMYTNFYYAKSTAGGATSITLNFSGGSTYVVAAVSEVAGLNAAAPLDRSAYHESLSSTSPWSSAALATSAAHEYLFAWAADEWNSLSCSNPTAGWTETQNKGEATLCLVDRTISSAGSYQVSVTPSAAFNYAMEIVGFKGASSTAPAPLAISTTTLPAATVGRPYSANLAATGGVTPYTWSASGLPSGLSISSNGTVSGTPTTSGTRTASLTVKDSSGATASSSLSLTIATQAVLLSISPTTATVSAGQSKAFTASVTGTTNTAVNWYVSGVQGGDASSGLISNGVYTAPPCGGSSTVLVTAQSVYAPASQASATVTLAAGSSSALDRYVSTVGSDSNDGSACSPWATLQFAANAAQAGMTIHVAPGTYNLSSIISTTNSGTSDSNRIRFISDQQWGAKISSTASQIWANSGSYVDIVGFDLAGSPSTYTGIHNMGEGDRAIGNRIHDMGSNGCNSGGGIMMGGGALYQSALANYIYNVGPAPAVPGCNQIHGIYAQESYCTIQNNITFHNAGIGIQLWNRTSHCLVTNNTSFGNRDGMVLGMDGSEGTTPVDYNVIANNILYNNLEYGFYHQDSGNLAFIGTHNQYLNNLISSNCSGVPDNCNDPSTGIYMVVGAMVNTIAANPQFVNYTGDAKGDYHPRGGSPALHHGATTAAPSTDFDGVTRGAMPDVGAYQWTPTRKPDHVISDARHRFAHSRAK